MTLLELQTDVRFITNTTSTSYSDTDLNRNLNRYYALVVGEILGSMDGWDFQGETATAYLVANQREYLFPSDCLRIKRIELKLDGTNWVQAAFFDINDTSNSVASEAEIIEKFNNNEPYVDIYDQSLFIYSGTIAAVDSGIKIWYEKDVRELSTGTDEPTIVEPYQRALVNGAAKDYFSKFQMLDRAKEQNTELETILARLRNFYGNKEEGRKVIATPALTFEDFE